MTGGLLTYMLVAKEMSIEEIYANVTEMLLAGVDTVRLGLLIHCRGVIRSGEVQHVVGLEFQRLGFWCHTCVSGAVQYRVKAENCRGFGLGRGVLFPLRFNLCCILTEHMYNIRAMLLRQYRVITHYLNHFRHKRKELKNIHEMGKKSLWKPKLLKPFQDASVEVAANSTVPA